MAIRPRDGLAQRAAQRPLALEIHLAHGHGPGGEVQVCSWLSGPF